MAIFHNECEFAPSSLLGRVRLATGTRGRDGDSSEMKRITNVFSRFASVETVKRELRCDREDYCVPRQRSWLLSVRVSMRCDGDI